MRNANVEPFGRTPVIVVWRIWRGGLKPLVRPLIVWPSSMIWRAEEVVVHLRESFPGDAFVILPEGEEPE